MWWEPAGASAYEEPEKKIWLNDGIAERDARTKNGLSEPPVGESRRHTCGKPSFQQMSMHSDLENCIDAGRWHTALTVKLYRIIQLSIAW